MRRTGNTPHRQSPFVWLLALLLTSSAAFGLPVITAVVETNGDDEATDTMRCPAGQVLRRKQLQRGKYRVLYAADVADCAACALRSRCTATARRIVARRLHEAVLQRMQERATPAVMRLRRCVVEHPFAALKYRIFEKPRFILRGRWGAGTEMSLATLVWNLKRTMAVLGNRQLVGRLALA